MPRCERDKAVSSVLCQVVSQHKVKVYAPGAPRLNVCFCRDKGFGVLFLSNKTLDLESASVAGLRNHSHASSTAKFRVLGVAGCADCGEQGSKFSITWRVELLLLLLSHP